MDHCFSFLPVGDLVKLLVRVYEGRREGSNWGAANYMEWKLFSFLIAAALFTSVVDGQYDATAVPPPQFSIRLRRLMQSSPLYGGYAPSPPPPWYTPPPSPWYTPPPSSPWYTPPPPPPWYDSPSYASPPPPPWRPAEGKNNNMMSVIVGSVIGGLAVFAIIGAVIKWKHMKPVKGDEEQPGPRDDTESTHRSPKESHAFLPVEGTAVAYSMEAQQAPAEAANGTTVAETSYTAKESGSLAGIEGPSIRTTLTVARHFSYNEILNITRNFGRVIGEGGSATVYYGQLQEGGRSVAVAVKKIKDSCSQFGNLLEEVKILMRIHHRNLVSLVGLCEEQAEIILVSEYMASGSLYDQLRDRSIELTWRKRLQIALDTATGLEYLHTGCKPAVIHRDIKSTNILLDENLEAKLADFGLSKAGAVDGSEYSAYQTKVAGTWGYIDPEYLYTQTLTKKSDVYSFGVVLFELITGKPAIVITESNEKCHITNWIMPMLMKGELKSLLDPLLMGHCNTDSVWEVLGVARTATQHSSGRPDMPEIVRTLKAALWAETAWPVSEIITSQSSFEEIPLNPVAR